MGSSIADDDRQWNREKLLPPLVGMRVSEAVDWLGRHDLDWNIDLPPLPATDRRDLLDAYVVKAQSPESGHQVGISYAVYLKAAVTDGLMAQWGDPTVTIPYVTGGIGLPRAYERLHARGLRVATNRHLSIGPYIDVIGQEPEAGMEVRRGTTVTLELDPKVYKRTVCCDQRRLKMPNVVGRNLGSVEEWLRRRGLYWELIDAPALPPSNAPRLLDPFVVTSQEPRPGTIIPEPISGSPDDIAPIRLKARLRAR